MAREDFSERGLPSAEVRRQILQRAGTILDEARDLVARLDQYEAAFSRSADEHVQGLERMSQPDYMIPFSCPATSTFSLPSRSAALGKALAA